jgi:hypothetical protein
MEPYDGDRPTRYRLRDEAQVRTLLDQSGQEEPRRADSEEVRPKRREVLVDEGCPGTLDRVRPAPSDLLKLDGGMVGAGLDEQSVCLVQHGCLLDPDRPGHQQDRNHVEESLPHDPKDA